MDQISDSEISLSDDEVCQLLEAVEEPGDQFLATYMGGDPFQLSLPSRPATQDLQVALLCLDSAYRTNQLTPFIDSCSHCGGSVAVERGLLSISLHVVDHHGLDVVQDPRVHPDEDGGLDAPDTSCLCLLMDGDLCSCGSVDPVESLQTRSNTVGDSLVLLPSCSVNLARLKAPGTRVFRNKVIVLCFPDLFSSLNFCSSGSRQVRRRV